MMMAEFSNTVKLLSLTLHLLLSITGVVCFPGTIIPLDPDVLVGSDLNITCKLNRTQTSSIASEIKWQIYDDDIGAETTVRVISTTEAQLTLRNLTLNDNGMWISCFLQGGKKLETMLLIGIVPPPPTLQCRSTNMTVYWCEWSQDYTGVVVDYTFQFKKKSEGKWRNCPNKYSENICTVNGTLYGYDHSVRVTAQNTFGSKTTTATFNSFTEAIPLPPIIKKVLAGETSVNVFWTLEENFKFSSSLEYQMRYRKSSPPQTDWIMLETTREKNVIIEGMEIGTEYELEVHSRFIRMEFSEWGPKSVVSVPGAVNMNVTTTAPDQFKLQWNSPDEHVAYYRFNSSYNDQWMNIAHVTEKLIVIDVACDIIDDVTYGFQVIAVKETQGVLVEGPPSNFFHTFECQEEVLVTTEKEYVSTMEQIEYVSDALIVPFLLVGIVALFGVLFFCAFKVYLHKRLFTEWPEPKFFKVEINSIQPRQVEKEIFDDLKTKSDFLTSYHSSTSSDQGFHELSPDSPISEEGNSYVRAPLLGSDETKYRVSPVNESSTEYLQLQQTGFNDVLQLSPLQTDHKRIESNSDPYTCMPLMSSVFGKSPENHVPELNYGADPYCKLDELLHASRDQSYSTEYIPVFTNETDYSGEDEGVINEDEIQNLLNGAPQPVNNMNYLCVQGDRVIF